MAVAEPPPNRSRGASESSRAGSELVWSLWTSHVLTSAPSCPQPLTNTTDNFCSKEPPPQKKDDFILGLFLLFTGSRSAVLWQPAGARRGLGGGSSFRLRLSGVLIVPPVRRRHSSPRPNINHAVREASGRVRGQSEQSVAAETGRREKQETFIHVCRFFRFSVSPPSAWPSGALQLGEFTVNTQA